MPKLITPFDLSEDSQIIDVAGTGPTTTDLRGTSAIGGVREWGALEYDTSLKYIGNIAYKLLTPFDLSEDSQLINVAGTSPTTTDMRGAGVIGAQREWGALEYNPNLLIWNTPPKVFAINGVLIIDILAINGIDIWDIESVQGIT